MPPIRTVKNQYRGINAHLHSLLQGAGGWDEFHTSYIVFLAAALRMQLLPQGYTTGIEQSLQIRRGDEPAGRPKSDVTIFDLDPNRARRPSQRSSSSIVPTAIPLPDFIDDLEEMIQYRSIAIYRTDAAKDGKGEPVAWIEILSPSNKPGGQDSYYYLTKRLKLLHSGVVFVEVDYLHETPPTSRRIPDYTRRDAIESDRQALFPYRILMIDPRPTYEDGMGFNYHFRVEEDIPPVEIPLSGEDKVVADFATPYNRAIEDTLFAYERVDYSQQPMHFERYSREDQSRILMRMATILTAASKGVDLEAHAPLPLMDNPNDEPPYGRLP